MRPTIRLKLLFASSSLLLVIFGGMTLYLVSTNTTTLRSRLQSEVKSFAALATPPIAESYNIYADSGTDQIRTAVSNYLSLNVNISNVAIVDLTGSRLFAYNTSALPSVGAQQAGDFKPEYITEGGQLKYVVYPYFSTSGGHPFSMIYTVSNAQVDAEIRHEVLSLLVFGLLLLVLTSVLTYILINRIIVRPIREVSRQAGVISAGDLGQEIHVHGRDEIASLGQAVNTMAESLKRDIMQLQEVDKVKSEFMAITSHNLRTPLTIINAYLESIDSFTTVDKLKQAISRIADSVKRLGSFSEDVLLISSIELGEKSQRETLAVASFMQSIADQARTDAELQKLQFVYSCSTDAIISVSPPYLRSAVWNLVDNALKFTPEGGKIEVSVTQDSTNIHISVTDTGIGIASAEIPKLFTKFHRATSVVKYDYEGTGIGLYASKIIIEQQGGQIAVTSIEGQGSTFTISLPVINP